MAACSGNAYCYGSAECLVWHKADIIAFHDVFAKIETACRKSALSQSGPAGPRAIEGPFLAHRDLFTDSRGSAKGW